MGGKLLLDPRWHWLQSALQNLYTEMDPGAVPVSLTLIIVDDEDLVSYATGPHRTGYVEKRVITQPTALMDAAEATTVCANVEEGDTS